MKRTVCVVMVLLMLLSTLVPVLVNAEKIQEPKEEVLFNKMANYFQPFQSLELDEVKSFVTKDVFSKIVYDIFEEEISKNSDLSIKLGDGSELKGNIDQLLTDNNISIMLSELKEGTGINSLVILKDFIEDIENFFEVQWEDIVNAELIESAKDIIGKVGESLEENVNKIFTDLEKHWAKADIEAMAALGIVNGYDDGTFKPEGKVTRAEFSKMIVLALELDIVTYDGKFTDIIASQWHADFIATMVKSGLAQGYPEGTFKPNGNITRTEMAVILSNVLKLEISSEDKALLLSSFKDANLIPDWATDAVAVSAKAELIKGDTESKFNPSNSASRAEAATVIYRLINK